MRKSYLFAGWSVLAVLFACGDDDGGGDENTGGSTLAATCARVCQRSNAADCKNDVKSECASECVQNATEYVPAACADELDAMFSCALKAKFTCDAAGEAQPEGCDQQIATFERCVLPNQDGTPGGNDGGTSKPDAGGNGGGIPGTLLCEPAAGDDACDTCSKSKCCAEFTACGADCQALGICLSECDDEPCVDACIGAHPLGSSQVIALGQCFEDKCPAECGDEDENAQCLSSVVSESYCTDPKRPVGRDCAAKPVGDCVLSPTGAANVYCCAE